MTRRLRMSDLFRLLEEASIAHTEQLGCTRDKTLDRGLLWIITRQLVEIDEMPAYDEEILVRSWQGEMQHVFFPRFYEIERAGEVIIRGQALWMLMEEEPRTMAMPEDYDIYIPGRPDAGDMMLPAVVIPEAAGEAAAGSPLVTRFSQVDINGHMNNTRYFDVIDDMLHSVVSVRSTDNADSNIHASDRSGYDASSVPADPSAAIHLCDNGQSARIPKKVLANYLSELRLGDSFTLRQYKDADTLWFEGAGDKPYFRIRYEY